MKDYPLFLAGRWKKTDTPLEVRSPYDGNLCGVTYLAGPEEFEEAIEKAEAAFKKMQQLPTYQRAGWLQKIAEGISERTEEFARTIAEEAGKPLKDARTEVKRAINTFRIGSEEAKRLEGEVIPLDTIEGSENRVGIVMPVGVGPVLGITPFNFPLNLVAHKVSPALASGNPIIVKPAPKAPLTSLLLAEVALEAGLPEGALSVLPAEPDVTERFVSDSRIKKLTFTGSAQVGFHLVKVSATPRITLELGGNAAMVVDESADVGFAVRRAVVGAFSYAGQVCISLQRLYVHRSLFDDFLSGFVEATASLKTGDPLDETTDVGPLITEDAAKRVESWIEEAKKGGAKLLTGGRRDGNIVEPTVVTDTEPSMRVCCEEVFGPVVVVESFEDFDEALSRVNDSSYGLQAGVFTKDVNRAFRAFKVLEVGGVIINDIPTYRVDHMPYGGVKKSGFGKEGVRYAIEEMTELKLMVLNLS